jgi:lipopolysaccharide transport system permease protein
MNSSHVMTGSLPERFRVRIEPRSRANFLEARELWAYRELLYFLVWRDLKVRYKQTALGVAWAVIQPLVTMLIFTLVFGRLAQLPSQGAPYALFTLAALLPWQLFSTAFTGAANSIVGNASLVTKVYFPRLMVPLAAVTSAVVDFAIALVLMGALMIWYRTTPSGAVFLLPAMTLLAVMTAFGIGLWTAALNVKYRDVRYALPFVMQVWLFISPVAYSSELVPERARLLFGLNPLVGIVEGFRWSLLGTPSPGILLVVSTLSGFALLIAGLVYFRKAEDQFADLI